MLQLPNGTQVDCCWHFDRHLFVGGGVSILVRNVSQLGRLMALFRTAHQFCLKGMVIYSNFAFYCKIFKCRCLARRPPKVHSVPPSLYSVHQGGINFTKYPKKRSEIMLIKNDQRCLKCQTKTVQNVIEIGQGIQQKLDQNWDNY